jgi:hypothetical protein
MEKPMPGSARAVVVGPTEAGYGLRIGPLVLPWLPAAVLFAVAGLAILSPVAADTWLALVGGREIVQSGLPAHDTLSSLAHGRDWIDQAWLAQLAFYGAYAVGGLGAVEVAGRIATTAAGLFAMATAAQRRSSPLACTLALIFGYILLVTRNELRPQLLAEPLFAALVWALAADARHPSRLLLWTAPIVLVLWANVHGSVLLGSGLVLLRVAFDIVPALARRRSFDVRRATWLASAAVVGPLASPYGLHLPRYYDSVFGNDSFRRYISEWWPTTPTNAPLAFFAIVAVVGLVAWQRRAIHAFDASVLLATAGAALAAQHNIVWFALAVVALTPPVLDRILPAGCTSQRLPGVAALCLCGALVGAFTLSRVATGGDASLMKAYPRSAGPIAAAAARDPHAYVLASPWLSDWLLFTTPALAGRIVADGRYELLTSAEFARYVETLDARLPLAGTYPHARILALNDSRELATRARRQPGARVLSSEPAMVVIALARVAGEPVA